MSTRACWMVARLRRAILLTLLSRRLALRFVTLSKKVFTCPAMARTPGGEEPLRRFWPFLAQALATGRGTELTLTLILIGSRGRFGANVRAELTAILIFFCLQPSTLIAIAVSDGADSSLGVSMHGCGRSGSREAGTGTKDIPGSEAHRCLRKQIYISCNTVLPSLAVCQRISKSFRRILTGLAAGRAPR